MLFEVANNALLFYLPHDVFEHYFIAIFFLTQLSLCFYSIFLIAYISLYNALCYSFGFFTLFSSYFIYVGIPTSKDAYNFNKELYESDQFFENHSLSYDQYFLFSENDSLIGRIN